jgi:hypothetical protein
MSCHVCRHDRELKRHKAEVAAIQAEARIEWRSTSVIQVRDNGIEGIFGDQDGVDCDWYLLNEKGIPTVIPSYGVYDLTWKKAMFLNPFEVDWMLFELHGGDDVDYIISLIEILQDQRDLWVNDEETREHPILVMFTRFLKSVRRLLMYSLNTTNLTY